jgi:Na+/H+-translocating membrane pyrophosphatase
MTPWILSESLFVVNTRMMNYVRLSLRRVREIVGILFGALVRYRFEWYAVPAVVNSRSS